MSSTKLTLRPGVNTNYTPLLNEASFSQTNLIRFFNGLIQQLGGWAKYIGTAFYSNVTGLFAWADLNGQPYVVGGTNGTLQVVYQSALYDITPQLSVVNLSGPFTTISGTNTMSVHSVAHGEDVGDVINIITETSINSKLLIGYQTIVSITDADNYVVSTLVTFTASVSGAVTALYTTVNTSPTITVTLVNHGLMVGQFYTVNVSTTVATVVLVGSYIVASVIDADNFTFVAGSNANASTSGHENGNNIRIEYLLHSGISSSFPSGGWSVGGYGMGGYGIGTASSAATPLRQWFFGNWGSFLIANPTNEGIYVWDPAGGVTGNPATLITQAPTANSMFISMPQRQVVALQADGDPLLAAWSDVDDYTDWTPTITNQAGSYRLSNGSRIVGGLQGSQQGLIWTDLDLWTMNYIQPPLVYGFDKVGTNCGLISARAKGIINGTVYWMSSKNFFMYNGMVNPLPCTVWDAVFSNLDPAQLDKITCGVNSAFNEITWYYPLLNGVYILDTVNGITSQQVLVLNGYVKYNTVDGVWDNGYLVRTAWIDQSVAGQPMGTDENNYLMQHEVSDTADGGPINSFFATGLFKISDGLEFIFLERFIPDFVSYIQGTEVEMKVVTYDYPLNAVAYPPYVQITFPQSDKSFIFDNSTDYIMVRSRGRFFQIQMYNTDQTNNFWRLGQFLLFGSPDGRR